MASAVVFVVSIQQTVSETDSVLWVFRPLTTTQFGADTLLGFRTPFINPNHAAEFFEIGAMATLGLCLFSRERWRLLTLGCGMACLIGVVLTGSTGGAVAALFGLCFLGSLRLFQTRWTLGRWVIPAAVAVVLLVSTVSVVRAGLGERTLPTVFQYDSRAQSKTAVWPETVRMIRHHAVVGVGRGGFRDAYPRFNSTTVSHSRSYAENEYLQVLAELGLIGGSLLLLTVVLTWAVALARWKGDPSIAGALAALLAVGVHSYVDFGLEFAGVGLPFAMLLGMCAASVPLGRPNWPWRRAVPLVVVPALALVFVPMTVRHGSHLTTVKRLASLPAVAESETIVEESLRWRPVSTDIALAVAGFYERAHDPGGALRWLGRAMYLAPNESTPHALAARTLAAQGAGDQALLELRLALERTDVEHKSFYSLLADLTEDPIEAARVLGPSVERQSDFVVFVLDRDPSSMLARTLTERLVAEHGTHPASVRAEAEVAVADGRITDAVDALQRAVAGGSVDNVTVRMLARCQTRIGDYEGARSTLDDAMALRPEDPWLWLEQARVEIDAGEWGIARRWLRDARAAIPHDGLPMLAYAHRLEGDLYYAEGQYAEARAAYQRVLALYPDRHGVRIKLGRVYRLSDRPEAALRELRYVRGATKGFPHLDQLIAAVEAEAAEVEAEAAEEWSDRDPPP